MAMARKGLTHITARSGRVGLPFALPGDIIGHLHSRERILQIPARRNSACLQPLSSEPQLDILFRFPDVFPPASKTKGLKPIDLQGNISGEESSGRPRKFSGRLLA